MSAGLRTYRPNGALRWDTTDRSGRFTGMVALPITNGSVALPGGGEPWWVFNNPDASENAQRPVVTSSGSTIYWTWAVPGAGSNASDLTLIVGVR